jgi:hypothetical protein
MRGQRAREVSGSAHAVGRPPPNHSNRVVFDESAMAAGAAVYAALALDALRE